MVFTNSAKCRKVRLKMNTEGKHMKETPVYTYIPRREIMLHREENDQITVESVIRNRKAYCCTVSFEITVAGGSSRSSSGSSSSSNSTVVVIATVVVVPLAVVVAAAVAAAVVVVIVLAIVTVVV
jgi:hypothetical protein